jgi:hypothetical protein
MQTHSASNSPPSNNPSLPQVRKAIELKCEWTGVEEERLIAFLVTVVDSSADAGNFKTVMWNAAAAEMAKYPTKVLQRQRRHAPLNIARYCTIQIP